jgi:hypothetical protein
VAGVAAAFLVVAAAIGFVAGGNGAMLFSGADGSAGSGDTPATARRGVGVSDQAFEPAAPGAMPSPAEIPGEQDALLPNLDAGDEAGAPGRFSINPARQLRDLSKIIRDGRISVVVGDGTFQENEDALTSIAVSHGGFVLSSSTVRERSGTFVLRIPAKRFDRALAQIRGLGEVRSQEVTGDDVTAEFIDFQARLKILQERRALLFRLFQDANTTDEILRLASQLDDVQLRIEQIQGQIRFINDQVAEATLRVTIAERNAPHTEPPPDIENPNLGSSFDLAVQGSLRIVGAVIVGLGYLIPLTILAGLIWLVVIALRRRRER